MSPQGGTSAALSNTWQADEGGLTRASPVGFSSQADYLYRKLSQLKERIEDTEDLVRGSAPFVRCTA